ncbi:hypothetical protein [Metapseudomonas otitidis]|uniref:hypothetical protein n=1 Tax=Metapseudomonas otitidis TaxID=319939 RepID=UPI00366DA8E8
MTKKCPFPFSAESREVMQSFNKKVTRRLREAQESFVDARNMQRFNHGRSWQSHQSHDPDRVSELSVHQHQFSLKIEDVVLGKVTVVPDLLNDLVKTMYDSFVSGLYKAVSDACDQSGNVVNANAGMAKAFIDMLEKVEFSVGRDGTVSLPEIHVGPGLIESIQSSAEMNSPEFKAASEEIIKRKSAEALDRESRRQARFVRGES